MSTERHDKIVAIGKDPISAASPVGDPVRYDEMFERLQAQMDRINSLSGEQVDWKQVTQLATDILTKKSKDLLVMTYLTLGLFETEGYTGLAAAFSAYKEFLDAYWEPCFPKVKPPHGRYNAIQYLIERLMPLVDSANAPAKKPPGAGDKAAVHAAADAVAALDTAVSKAFTGMPDTPNMLPLVRAFKTLREKVGPLVEAAPPPGAPPAADAAGAPPAAGAAPAPAGGSPSFGAVPTTFTTVNQAIEALVKIAKYLLSQDPKDARGYRLLRLAYFSGWTEMPRDGVVPAPPATRKALFENLAATANWTELLAEAEAQFAITPLWFDMQRYSALALGNLGGPYKAAQEAVILEVIALRSRLAGITDLAFKDGTGFADGATKAWIDEHAGRMGGGGGGGAGGGDDPLAAALGEARKLLGESKQSEAIARLAQAVDCAAGRRQRFRAQLALAGVCLDMSKHALALSILEGLERLIDEYHLDDWEPELAAQAMEKLFDCLLRARPKPTPPEIERQNAAFARLCRLNPSAALKLDPSGKPKA